MGATTMALGARAAGSAYKRRYPWPLGVQLWSVNTELGSEFDGTLRKLAALGFKRVEAAGWHGRDPAAFRRSIEAAGLRCDSAHVAMPELAADARGSVAKARDAGCDYLVCSSPLTPTPLVPGRDWMTALTKAMTRDAWKRNAALLNEAASVAAAADMKFGYHNHAAEFASYDGQRGYDVLLAATDPKAVLLELDVAWAIAGGQDPMDLIRTSGGRIVRLHLKDLRTKPREGQMTTDFATVPLGQGVIEWRSIIEDAAAVGVGGAYLELEPPHLRSPFDELAQGREFLRML